MNFDDFLILSITALIAYLFGSIPFGYLLVHIFTGKDIRTTGSGNIGATNVARSGAKGLAIATLVLDALKGALPVWYISRVAEDAHNFIDIHPNSLILTLPSLIAFFAVLGHMVPVWLKFKGGKGVATALGVFTVLAPKAILISLLIFVMTMAVTKIVSLGSILSAAVFPFTAYWLQVPLRTWPSMIMVSAIALLIIMKHHGNIKRLMNGTEPKFGSRMPAIDIGEGGEA
jgi:glycerol-3-phosphate acyltransferase PlsY